jgi:hypothetical protein
MMSELLQNLSDYLNDKLSIDSFRDWMVDFGEKRAAMSAAEKSLMADLEARYAELSDHLISDDLFKKSLKSLVVPVTQVPQQPAEPSTRLMLFYYHVSSVSANMPSVGSQPERTGSQSVSYNNA